ncbi:MAG: class I SAM-dependent methyltransferase [Candidatus Cloacimonetes bacterium]|nr:class I SAM-dependent methyltransferase [Candidatus Cloacimonadota bacterium]
MKDLYNWNEFVNLYDWEFDFMCDEQKHDVEFYQSMIHEKRGNVLEIGCGTGRITRELVKCADSVTAVDNASAFLNKLHDQLYNTNNLETVLSEMTDLCLNKQFDTIIVSYSTFQYLLDKNMQIKALKVFKKHLKEDGQILIDISPCTALTESLNVLTPIYHHYHSALNADITMLTSYQVDSVQKIQYWTDKYMIKYREKTVNGNEFEEFIHHLALKRVDPEDMNDLAKLSGLKILNIYGTYLKGTVTAESNNWFFVLTHDESHDN